MSSLLMARRQGAPAVAAPLADRPGLSPRPLSSAAAAPIAATPGRTPALSRPPRALPEWLAKIVDFESWAPRSSRMWRLDQYSYERSTSSSDEELERERELDGLQARVEALRRQQQRDQERGGQGGRALAGVGAGRRPGGDDADEDDEDAGGNADSGIDDSAPLTAGAIARAAAEGSGSNDDDGRASVIIDDTPPLTSDEMRALMLVKWQKQYDMAFVRRDLPGMRPFVALNIYPHSLEQRSFILTQEQYVEKLDAICARLHVLGQTSRVRAFLQAPAKSQKGLPRRPTMGTAVSISLDVTPAQVEAYFTGPF